MIEKKYATHWKQAAPMPSGFLGKSRSFLRHSILSTLALTQGQLSDKFLRCLYCHNVFDDQREGFESLLVELKRQATFIDTDTCVKMLKGELTIDRRYFHLSFDDGFRNNFKNAFPILKRHEIPCIFFVPSALVGADWITASKYCLETTLYRDVVELIRWEDLSEMVSSGYAIGSHTRTHSRFSEISRDPDLLEREIAGSKIEIEKGLGVECKYISWPFGLLSDADRPSLEKTRKAGYHACFSAVRGSVVPHTTNLFAIPRHHFEVQWPLSHVKYFAAGRMEVRGDIALLVEQKA